MTTKFIDDFDVNNKRWVIAMIFLLLLFIFSTIMFLNIEGSWRYYFVYSGCFSLSLIFLIRGNRINYAYYWKKDLKTIIRKCMLVSITHEYLPVRLYYFYLTIYIQLVPSTILFIILNQVIGLSDFTMIIFTVSYSGVVLIFPTIIFIYLEIKEASICRKEKEKLFDILRHSKGKQVFLKYKDYDKKYYEKVGVLVSYSDLNTEITIENETVLILSSQIIDVKVIENI